MFLLLLLNIAIPVSTLQSSSNPFQSISERAKKLQSGFLYKVVKGGEKNHLAQRVGMEAIGVDLPTVACELALRGWESAAGAGLRISLFILNSLIIPTIITPGLNILAKNKFSLPQNFKKLFLNQFQDLVPEKSNPISNEEFVQKMEVYEGKQTIESYFYDSKGDLKDSTVSDFKEKLIKAKSYVVKWDYRVSGVLSYLVPWCQNWFEQSILGLIGFSGENRFLDDSQKEESVSFHNKFKWLKFGIGLVPTIWGGEWVSNNIEASVRTKDADLSSSKVKSFMKKHIKQFDYHKGIFANKLNLAGLLVFSGDAGMLLSTRSIGEFVERCFRLSAFWPSFIYGIEWIHSKVAGSMDKRNDIKLIDPDEPAELGIQKVKTIDKLEKEFDNAIKTKDVKSAEKVLTAMEKAPKAFGWAFFGNSALLGVALNLVNYVFMKIRIARGIY